jgi:exopolysaccharide production protein ExoQ
MQNFKVLAEKIFVIFALFVATSGLIPVLVNPIDASGIIEDPFTPLIMLGVYSTMLAIIATRWKSFFFVAQKDIFIWLLAGIVIASILWTIAPDITPRRSILVLGTTIFGVYFAARYSTREQLQLLGWTFGIVVLMSFVFAVAMPYYGVMSVQEGGAHAGAWRGIMTHKNMLGRLMNVSALVFLILGINNNYIFERKYRWLPWFFYALSLVLIILCTSKTALLVFVTLTLLLPLYRSLRQKFSILAPLLIALTFVGGSAAILLLDNLEFIASAFGRDLTLTGRTDLWNVVIQLIQERPLFGYGFSAFWRGWDSQTSAYIWRTMEWEVPYGHNGFLDLTAELGLVGLVTFTLSYLKSWIQAIAWLRLTKTGEGLWPIMYLTFLLMYNLTEGTLIAHNSIFWILYVSCLFSMAVESEQMKQFNWSNAVLVQEEWSEDILES